MKSVWEFWGTAMISIWYRVEPWLRHGVESPGGLRNYNLQLFAIKTKNILKKNSATVLPKNEWRTYMQLSCLRKGYILFCRKKPVWFYQNVLWNWYHQNECFCGHMFQHTVEILMGTKLWSSASRLVPLLVRGILHTGASHETQTDASLIIRFLV